MELIFLPLDVFERHKIASEGIRPGEIVLDVGGGVNALARFVKNKIVVSNLYGRADVLADGRNLPFGSNSFDVVTSIDVIEHLSKKDRRRFIKELLRVSRRAVIFSSPLGTTGHREKEKEVYNFLLKRGIKSKFLSEHLKKGLPSAGELAGCLAKVKFKVIYSGNYRLSAFLTKLDALELKDPKFNKLFYWFKKLINVGLILFYFPFSKSGKEKEFTNRIYFFVEK